MKALAQILFEISCTQDFQNLLSKEHNSDMKKWVNYFFMGNVHMKFQNPSIHGSQTNTHTQTDKLKAICPSNVFKVGGIKTVPLRMGHTKVLATVPVSPY